MSRPAQPIFAPPSPRPTLTLARGERVWRMTVRPAAALAAALALTTIVVAGVGSTALFLASDDVASAFRAREARTVSAYEKRIADLRRDLDRAVSREHSERREFEAGLSRMLDRQRVIEQRFDQMQPLVAQARSSGLIPADMPLPSERPDAFDAPINAYAPRESAKPDFFSGFDLRPSTDRSPSRSGPQQGAALAPSGPTTAETLAGVAAKVEAIEENQVEQLALLAEAAEMRAAEIAGILVDVGVRENEAAAAMGGPFVPVPFVDPFTNELTRLADALSNLRDVQQATTALPLRAPVENAAASSNFGVRLDPFFRRPAMHAGIDYPAPTGTPVLASAPGKVSRAGRRGGYGLMVEIDHGAGHVTRYAHLSAIDVAAGQTISGGDPIGRVGSTGRSTGPHLHYEVRRSGKAIDPTRYLRAGEVLSALR